MCFIRERRIAAVEELARDRRHAVLARSDVGCLGHRQNCECGSKLEGQFRLQSLYPPRQISDLEKSSDVDRAAIENVTPIDVCETDRRQIHSATRDYAALDADIVEVFLLYGSAGLDLNETPSSIPTAMKHIDAHYHSVVLKNRLKKRGNLSVGDQLPRGADRLIEPTATANFDPTRKQLPGEQPYLTPLLEDCFGCRIGLRCEVRRVSLPVEALEALHTSHEF
jgi:hypothetical protein